MGLVSDMAFNRDGSAKNQDKVSINSNKILSQSDLSENMFDFALDNW